MPCTARDTVPSLTAMLATSSKDPLQLSIQIIVKMRKLFKKKRMARFDSKELGVRKSIQAE